jgi:hypothetical protein
MMLIPGLGDCLAGDLNNSPRAPARAYDRFQRSFHLKCSNVLFRVGPIPAAYNEQQ